MLIFRNIKSKFSLNPMKYIVYLLLFLSWPLSSAAQQVIPLKQGKSSDLVYQNAEKRFYSKAWQTEVITNVSVPELLVFEPETAQKNGTAVVIAPGGGLYALSINSEGIDVAKWLTEHGITAFVLKYRLVPSGEDGSAEFGNEYESNPEKTLEKVKKILPYAIEDGLNSIAYIRKNAVKYGINPNKIGFMGFSAGGAVNLGVVYNYTKDTRPDFIAPIYAWTSAMPVKPAPEDAPPLFLVCASNDGLGLASGSIDIYNSWYKRGISSELHMYAKGNHGFGMKTQNLPSDHWIERFYEWMLSEKLTK
jgi:acetyl esterase/lipase